MKKILLLVIAVPVLVVLVIVGRSLIVIDGRPPEYSVTNPSIMPDGAGGFLTAYQVNKGDDGSVYLQRIGEQGNALWDENGLKLVSSKWGVIGGEAQCAFFIPGDDVSVMVVYPSPDGVLVRKIDEDGHPQWNEDVTAFPGATQFEEIKSVSDGAGGVLIARLPENEGLELRRVSSDGTVAWSTELASGAHKFDIAGDDSGASFIIWKDLPNYTEGQMYVQKVDPDGTLAWDEGGIQLTDEQHPGFAGQRFQNRITADGTGGAMFTWPEAILTADGRGVTGYVLYAQRLNSEGQELWGSNGTVVTGMTTTHEPSILRSSEDTFTILWENMHFVYGQQLDSAGGKAWSEDGLELALSDDIMYYSAATDGDGGVGIVLNNSKAKNHYLYAQYINDRGEQLWGKEGIRVATAPAFWAEYSIPGRIASDGAGGFIVSWASGKSLYSTTTSYIQRITAEGDLVWGDKGIRLDN